MVSRDKHNIEVFYRCAVPRGRFFSCELRVLARWSDHRDVRIVVLDFRTLLNQKLHEHIARRFAFIVDVRLVSQSQNQNPGTIESLSLRVESSDDSIDDIFWHCCVNLACKFDKARMFAVLARFPRQIEWIDWDTMPAQTRSWIESHEPKRLCFRGFDHFPDVDAHRAVN